METNTLGGPTAEESNENLLSPKILLKKNDELYDELILDLTIDYIKKSISVRFNKDPNLKSFLIELDNVLTDSEEALKKIKSKFEDAGWIVKEKIIEKKYMISLFNRSYKVWEFSCIEN